MENNRISFSFDHYTIEVIDLEKSLFFYHRVLGFPVIERPDFDFEGAWLDIGNHQAIHLILNKDMAHVESGSRRLHFAFSHHDLDRLTTYLDQYTDVEKKPIKHRPDRVRQLFVKDPDGYYVEFCEK